MGHKIFVSYKYADLQVANINGKWDTTVRSYVDELESKLDSSNHIYKGESSGEDLSQLSEDTIWQRLRDRIFDSTLTIIMISPGMRDSTKTERNQWIPWEVSFSLRTTTRKTSTGSTYTSNPNAMFAVVLPDSNGSYDYFLEKKYCCTSKCTMHHTNNTFKIIRDNMFNSKVSSKRVCGTGSTIWTGSYSYIEAVRWSDFLDDLDGYIDSAYDRQDKINDYDLHIVVE